MIKKMETVLYYNPGTPEAMKHTALMKSVLVRMGIRIKNISRDQVMEQVGYLAGLPGFESAGKVEELPEIPEQVMILKQFSSSRIDALLMNLRKAGVPKIELKAVLTESNSKWSFYQLYEELRQEHEAMTAQAVQSEADGAQSEKSGQSEADGAQSENAGQEAAAAAPDKIADSQEDKG